MRRISARISSRSLASRFDSGSSISTSGGSMTMARAMATRCCWPPESWPGSLSSWSSSRTSASASSTLRVDLGLRHAAASSDRSRCSCARSCAGTARSSGTPCRSRAPPACSWSMRCSSSQMLPPVTGSRPAMQLSAVDLPQPDGPSRAMNSPRRTVSVTSLAAR